MTKSAIAAAIASGISLGLAFTAFATPAVADKIITECKDGFFAYEEHYVTPDIACIGHGGALKKAGGKDRLVQPKKAPRASSVLKKDSDTGNSVIGKV